MILLIVLIIPLVLLGVAKLVELIIPEEAEAQKINKAYDIGYKQGEKEGHRNASIILEYAIEFIHKDRERLTEYQEAPQLLREEIEDSFSYWLNTRGKNLFKK